MALKPCYRECLDEARCDCGVPACESPVTFNAKCHPGNQTFKCWYFDGIVTVTCAVCDDEVIRLVVAREGGP